MNTKTPETIAALEQQLGIPCQYSAWWIGRRLLQEVWKGRPKVIRDTTFDLRDLPFMEAARDIAWRRALEPQMIGRTVHHYDKNSQYLSACRSVNCGIGDPVHVAGGDDGTAIKPGLPGIYRIAVYQRGEDLYTAPIIEPGQEWVTSDVLIYAQQRGYQVYIYEAWVFPDYTKILDKWAEKIWNARAALKGVNDEAYREMKNIAIVGVGSFATSKEKKKTPGWDLIHPNFWADVVGKARVNMLCNITKYGAPVLVETDGLYYVSRDENYRTAVPGILDRMGLSGGYKHEGSFVLTEEIYGQARTLGVGELAALFKVAGGER
jgi:hypothetical protein